MAGFSILLPPSDDKVSGGNSLAPKMFDRRSSHTFNYFVGLNPERRQVVEALRTFGEYGDDPERALGVTAEGLDHALSCNSEVMVSPLMSALDRFNPGVLFQAMDFENLPTGAQRRLLEHGIILSPLFGILRPDDLIPEYYLSLEAEFPETGPVKSFWTPFVSKTLNDLLAHHFVWNLLPPEYAGIWERDGRHKGFIDVGFFNKVKGKLVPIEDGLDELRGRFVNTLVRGSSDALESLTEFEEPGTMSVADVKWDEGTRTGKISVVPA